MLGLIVTTLGVYGIARFPDVYTQLHASSKAALRAGDRLVIIGRHQDSGPFHQLVVD